MVHALGDSISRAHVMLFNQCSCADPMAMRLSWTVIAPENNRSQCYVMPDLQANSIACSCCRTFEEKKG